MVMCLSNAMDLVSQAVVGHQKQVAYIASCISTEIGVSTEEQNSLLLAGLLHDSGAFSLKEKLDILQFEGENLYKHAEVGYLLFKDFEPFSKIATPIRYHHTHWGDRWDKVPTDSHILHLADRAAVLISRKKEILGQVEGIYEIIEKNSRTMFMPELVNAFRSLSTKEYFWLDAVSSNLDSILERRSGLTTIKLDIGGLLNLAKLFCQIIDFRSRFTATHSSAVAATAETLSRLIGFCERECQMMKIAGYLHDLGKLAVPAEILEKPAKLTKEEFNIIKSHTFYAYRILETISELDIINAWASFHHERLDGSGYPFHHKGEDLSLGSRIIAVADVFTAIAENRPYRKGMPKNEVLQILQQMAQDSALDSNVVSTLIIHYDEVNSICISAKELASNEYQKFGQQ
jgi:HD-GYP domain-containing protein (c-di-GMP phosphodiesterase class II)